MSTVPSSAYVTPEEYLRRERVAGYKSEYFAGEVFAMAGASERHNLIAVNGGSELRFQFKGRDCRVYIGDMRVKVRSTGLYTYSDIVVVCGEPQFEDEEFDTLLNPTLLIEILSPSTEAYDRGKKFEHYRRIESLREVALISQEKPLVERFLRQDDGQWLLGTAEGLDATIRFESVGAELPLAEIYDRIEFAEEPPPEEERPQMDANGRR